MAFKVISLGVYAFIKQGANNVTLYQLAQAEAAGLWPSKAPDSPDLNAPQVLYIKDTHVFANITEDSSPS